MTTKTKVVKVPRQVVKLKHNPFKDIEFVSAKLLTEIPDTSLPEVSIHILALDSYKCQKVGLIKFYPVELENLVRELEENSCKEPMTVFISNENDDGDNVLSAVTLYHPYTALDYEAVWVININTDN